MEPATTAAIIGGAANIIGGIFGSSAAKKAQRKAARRARRLQKKLNGLEANRQSIIDPYASVTDLSSMVTNPFSQLGVATQAAEMQIEQADISLANTLDTIRSTGASAGGATALAQAALQGKKGVAANIEQQEAQNEKMRVEGEKQRQQQLMSEQMRQQEADVQGTQFTFGIREGREQGQIDRTFAEMQAARQAAGMAAADRTSAITGAIGSVASIAGGFFGKQ